MNKLIFRRLFLFAFSVCVFTVFSQISEAATFTVNSTGDASDSLLNGTCDVGAAECTFRGAIEESNATVGADQIEFNIGGGGAQLITIGLTSLPSIIYPLSIDGSTQPGATCSPRNLLIEINLNGNNLYFVNGSSGSSVRGLNLYGTTAPIDIGFGSDGSSISCNHIGTNLAGSARASVVAMEQGIRVGGANNTQIGGTGLFYRNVISGSLCEGVRIDAGNNTSIQGNYIGTDITGTIAISNEEEGVEVIPDGITISGVNIGGTNIGEENLISKNGINVTHTCGGIDAAGVQIAGMNNGIIDDIIIQGNLIGISSDDQEFGNAYGGILIAGSLGTSTIHNVQIGGNTALERNVISNNGVSSAYGSNLKIQGVDTFTINGNYIGTESTGLVPLINYFSGITVSSSIHGMIGGITPGDANIIPGGHVTGISIAQDFPITGASDISIFGNKIGIDVNGDASTGNVNGVDVALSVSDIRIGGINIGEGNIIANNSNDGVRVMNIVPIAATPDRISVLGNSIYDNGALGIDIQSDSDANFVADVDIGVNLNDAGDADAGPNDKLNFPVITNVDFMNGDTTVDFSLDVPAGDYRIEFFENAHPDISGNGEGQAFIAFSTISHTGNGLESFSYTFSGPAGNISLTATEDLGGLVLGATSEFGVFNQGSFADFGDAPDSTSGTAISDYNTLSLHTRPYHLFGGSYLGDCVDSDLGDLQNSNATADDITLGTKTVGICTVPGNDDDGVIFTSDFEPGRFTSLDVTASGGGFLNAWVDFNQDGDFLDTNEQIFTDEVLSGGVNSLSFLVPTTSLPDVTFARFRMDSGGGITPTSSAPDGEIEDYQIEIVNLVTVSPLTDASEPSTDGEAIIDLGILNPGPGSVDITYAFTGGTALSGIDFLNTTTILSIPSGSQTATIIVPIIDDMISEGSETIEITLTSSSLGVLPNDGSEVFTLDLLDNEFVSVSHHGGCGSCHDIKRLLPQKQSFVNRPVDLEEFLPCKYDVRKDIYKDFPDAQSGNILARDAFQTLYRLFAVNGKENGKLEIRSHVSRAESAKILYGTSGCDRKDFEVALSHYDDVQSSSWQNFYVGLGTKDNVMQGYGDGTFRPNQSISRSEFLKIVLLSMGYNLNDIMSIELNPETQFLDASDHLSEWQLKFAQFGKEMGLVNGYASGAFGFNNPISRGEAAIIIEKAFIKEIESIVKESSN